MSAREGLGVALIVALAAGLLLGDALFGERSILAFDLADPRLDLRPWVDFGGATDVPINPLAPDLDLYVLPGLMRVRQLAAQGAGPWWDGAQLLGYPLGANVPFPIFSPPAWVAAALDPVTALDVLLWMHLALAGFGAWRCVRMLGGSTPAGALGAVGFALSAWMATRWRTPQVLFTAAWWPWLVVSAEWLRRGRWRRGVVEGSLCGGLALVAGFPQVGLYMLCAAGLLAVWWGVAKRAAGALSMLAVGVLAIALAAPQLAVSATAYEHSLRSARVTRAETVQRGLPPAALVGAALPRFFGHPPDFAGARAPAPTAEQWLPQRRFLGDTFQNTVMELALYPGALLLLLLPVLGRRALDRRARALAGVAGVALLICLVWPHLARAVPLLAPLGAGNVKRLLVITAGCWPLAGALAFDAVRAGRAPVPLRWFVVLLVLIGLTPLLAARLDDPSAAAFADDLTGQVAVQAALLLGGLALLVGGARARGADARGGTSWAWCAVLLLALDLGWGARSLNPLSVQRPPFPSTASLEALRTRTGRVAVLGDRHVLPPTGAALHGVRSLHGAAPMVPARSAELLACIEGPLHDPRDPRILRPFTSPDSFSHPLLDLLEVDTAVFGDRAYDGRIPGELVYENVDEGLALVDLPGDPGPRGFMCRTALVVPDPAERLALLARDDFPVHRLVVLERARDALPGMNVLDGCPDDPGSLLPVLPLAVGSVADDAHGMALPGGAATGPPRDGHGAGVVVLSESWDPGWQVTVDGVGAETIIVDHALLGVSVAADARDVRFSYVPPRLAGSVLTSLAALLALALLSVWRPRAQRRR